jgi:hypothetical protein
MTLGPKTTGDLPPPRIHFLAVARVLGGPCRAGGSGKAQYEALLSAERIAYSDRSARTATGIRRQLGDSDRRVRGQERGGFIAREVERDHEALILVRTGIGEQIRPRRKPLEAPYRSGLDWRL